jgi:hypothetical protein
MDDNKPDFTIDEVFAEVMADDSWEPDEQKRVGAVMGLNFALYI